MEGHILKTTEEEATSLRIRRMSPEEKDSPVAFRTQAAVEVQTETVAIEKVGMKIMEKTGLATVEIGSVWQMLDQVWRKQNLKPKGS